MKYKDNKEGLRYLGAWQTADLEEKEGLIRLKEKIKGRMDRIEGLRAGSETKATLMKARVLSLIDYTAAIQKIDKEHTESMGKKNV